MQELVEKLNKAINEENIVRYKKALISIKKVLRKYEDDFLKLNTEYDRGMISIEDDEIFNTNILRKLNVLHENRTDLETALGSIMFFIDKELERLKNASSLRDF